MTNTHSKSSLKPTSLQTGCRTKSHRALHCSPVPEGKTRNYTHTPFPNHLSAPIYGILVFNPLIPRIYNLQQRYTQQYQTSHTTSLITLFPETVVLHHLPPPLQIHHRASEGLLTPMTRYRSISRTSLVRGLIIQIR